MVKGLAGIGCVLALIACSPAESGVASSQSQMAEDIPVAADKIATHPISGLQIINVTVKSSGKTLLFKTELADTGAAQSRGLMFRTELGDDEAMIFPTKVPQQRSFWMKNTPLSLDIIFIGPDKKILNIAANTVPYSLESVSSAGLAIAVLEIRGGLAEKQGIKPGDEVAWDQPEN